MGGSPNSIPRRDSTGVGPVATDDCPGKFRAVITSPRKGLAPGEWLDLTLDKKDKPPRVVFADASTGSVVGSLAAYPNLNVLIHCIESGVRYRAHVERVSGGRVDVTVVKQ